MRLRVYVPTDVAARAVKDTFYNSITTVLSKINPWIKLLY